MKDNYPVYKLSKEHLEAVRELNEPAAKAAEMGHTAQEHLRGKGERNPKYESLSERIEQVINRWRSGQLADPDAVETLEQLELEIIQVEEEAEKRDLNEAAKALFFLFRDELEISSDEAEEYAKAVCRHFEEHIDINYENWAQNDKTRRQIRKEMYRAFANLDRPDIAKETVKDGQLVDYLVKNYGQADV